MPTLQATHSSSGLLAIDGGEDIAPESVDQPMHDPIHVDPLTRFNVHHFQRGHNGIDLFPF
jgi:hypothetical protein